MENKRIVPEGQTPLDAKLNHRFLDVLREGAAARDAGTGSPYHGHSLEHGLHAAGWVSRDLRLALDKCQAALDAPAEVGGLVERLRVKGRMDREQINHHIRRMEVERIEAATALTALQADNERLRGEIEELQGAQILDRAALRLQKMARKKAEAERDQARAEAAAAYERAATVQVGGYDMVSPVTRATIRALATEAETTALAEMLDAETLACAEVVRYRRQGWLVPYILARIDQRKGAGV